MNIAARITTALDALLIHVMTIGTATGEIVLIPEQHDITLMWPLVVAHSRRSNSTTGAAPLA